MYIYIYICNISKTLECIQVINKFLPLSLSLAFPHDGNILLLSFIHLRSRIICHDK